MPKSRYVALLRGINVGGNNVIRMVALRESFEAMGFVEVTSYIQSGNVVFSAEARGRRDKMELASRIEATLTKTFDYASKVVLVSAEELARVVADAPRGFGEEPSRYRYDVLFVKEPVTTREAFAYVTTAPEVDEAHAGQHVLYFRRLIAQAGRSHLTKIVQRPIYKSLTIRNWRTTTKLLAMAST